MPSHEAHPGNAPAYAKPLPTIDPLIRPYWAHAKAHRLSVQKCHACGDLHFPPSPVCPRCLSEDQGWHVASGRATLVSWGRFHRAYWKSFGEDVPYDVCVVQLEEGPMIVSNFAGETPDGLHLGLRLKAVFDDVTPEVSLVRFVVDA
jgi:uncharacterized OB-fold protein